MALPNPIANPSHPNPGLPSLPSSPNLCQPCFPREDIDGGLAPRLARVQERCAPSGVFHVGVGASVEEHRDDAGVALIGRHHQSGTTIIIHAVHVVAIEKHL